MPDIRPQLPDHFSFGEGRVSVLDVLAAGGIFENPALAARFRQSCGRIVNKLDIASMNVAYQPSKRTALRDGQYKEHMLKQLASVDPAPENTEELEVACGAGVLTGIWSYLHQARPEIQRDILPAAIEKTVALLDTLKKLPAPVRAQYIANSRPVWDHCLNFWKPMRNEGRDFPETTITLALALSQRIGAEENIAGAEKAHLELLRRPWLKRQKEAALKEAPADWSGYQSRCDAAARRQTHALLAETSYASVAAAVAAAPVVMLKPGSRRLRLGRVAVLAGVLNGLDAYYQRHKPLLNEAVTAALKDKIKFMVDGLDHNIVGRKPVALFLSLTKDARAHHALPGPVVAEPAATDGEAARTGLLVRRAAVTQTGSLLTP